MAPPSSLARLTEKVEPDTVRVPVPPSAIVDGGRVVGNVGRERGGRNGASASTLLAIGAAVVGRVAREGRGPRRQGCLCRRCRRCRWRRRHWVATRCMLLALLAVKVEPETVRLPAPALSALSMAPPSISSFSRVTGAP